MKRTLACTLAVLSLGISLPLVAQESKHEPKVEPTLSLEAELVSPLLQDKLKAGSPVVARTLQQWKTRTCTVAMGTLIEGELVSVESDSSKKSASVTIRFNPVTCTGQVQTRVTLKMFSLLIPPDLSIGNNFAKHGGIYAGYASIVPDGTTNYATAIGGGGGLHMDWESPQKETPRTAQMGSVIGSKNFSLDANGPDGSFVIHEKGKRVELYAGSIFILVPHENAHVASAPSGKTDEHSSESAPATPRKPTQMARQVELASDDSTVCVKDCSVVALSGAQQLGSTEKADIINLERYGYSHVAHHAVQHFAVTDALVYLDETHLLFTFDRHVMRRRLDGGIRPEYERSVRAVVIDCRRQQVVKIVDWKVLGEGQYIWPSGQGHVLAHVGHKLVLLDSELKPQSSFDVAVPLAWVASDPSGSTYAVGQLKELHSQKLHDVLLQTSGREPEESTQVTFLNSELKPFGTSTQPSTLEAPVLAEDSEILMEAAPGGKWTLEEISPVRSKRSIATVISDCPLRASMPSEKLVFVVGCRSGQNWYKAFRSDGHMVLRGTNSSLEVEQAAVGEASQRAFAVRVVESTSPLVYDPEYKQTDLPREYIGVYRLEDGRQLFAKTVSDVAFTEQSFAVSPGARQLAVLSTRSLMLFNIPEVTTSR